MAEHATYEDWVKIVSTLELETRIGKLGWTTRHSGERGPVYECQILQWRVQTFDDKGETAVELVVDDGARWRLPETPHTRLLLETVETKLEAHAAEWARKFLAEPCRTHE